MRPSGRSSNQLRKIRFELNVNIHAEGSCLVSFGETKVLCTASIEDRVPPFLRNTGRGWVTAEYGMLPRSTGSRINREAARGKQSGRTHEIQRLIGRSLRAVTDLTAFGERQLTIDCDVIQADGGTRTASISGAYLALYLAFLKLLEDGTIKNMLLFSEVAAVSCGIYKNESILDLDYAEDSNADTDANFIITGEGEIVEIQATAETNPFSKGEFNQLLTLAEQGVSKIIEKQRQTLTSGNLHNAKSI